MRVIGNISAFNGTPRQLQQRRGVIGHLLDKAHHQRVATKTELLQVHQAEDLSWQVGQQVVVETQRPQRVEPGSQTTRGTSGQCHQPSHHGNAHLSVPHREVVNDVQLPGELRGDALDAVVTEDQVAEGGQVSHLWRDG